MEARDTNSLRAAALRGEDEARGELLERLRPRLVLWASSRLSAKLRARLEPEDVAQEVLLAVHKAFDDYREQGDRAFYAWFFRIAENRIRDLADYHGAQKRKTVERTSFSQTTPSVAAMRAEALECMRNALSRLSEDHAEVIRLRSIEGLGVAEVARRMDRSENAVRILYCRALKALRVELSDSI